MNVRLRKKGASASLYLWVLVALSACGGKREMPEMASADLSMPIAQMAAVAEGAGAAQVRHLAVTHQLVVESAAQQLVGAWTQARDACVFPRCEVVNASVRRETERQNPSASLVMRVVPEAVPDTLKGLESQAQVLSHDTQSEDKTGEVIDVEAHIKNRTELRDRLRRLLSENGANRKLSDLLDIETKLADVQTELDSSAAQRASLALQTERQLLTVNFQAERSVTRGGAGTPIADALRNAGEVFANSLAVFISFVAAALPWLLILIPGFWVLRKGWRRFFTRRQSTPK